MLDSVRGSVAGLLLATACTHGVFGDVHTLYVDADTHVYATTGMPDFDQRRHGLLESGACHCGPTSATNLLSFIAMHGNEHVVPFLPEISWDEPGTYSEITAYLRQFGINAGTEATDDSCSTSHAAVIAEINAAGNHWVESYFDVSTHAWDRYDSRSVPPRMREFTARLAGEEALGLMYRGTWGGLEVLPGIWSTTGLEDRVGGHYMTVQASFTSGDAEGIRVRDSSGNTGDIFTQSAFESTEYAVSPLALFLGTPDYKMVDRLGDPYVVQVSVEQPDGTEILVNEYRQHIFYGYMLISPKSHFTWGEGDHILERVPAADAAAASGGSGHPSIVEMSGPITGVASDSSGRSTAVIAGGRLNRVHMSRTGGLLSELLDFEVDDNGIIEFDRSFGLHLVEGRDARLIDWRNDELLATASLPAPGTALVVIDEKPHVLMPDLQAIASLAYGEPGENPVMTTLALPSSVFANNDSRLAMLPGGRIFLLTDGTLQPMRIGPNGLESIPVTVPRNGQWRQVFRAGTSTICLADESNRVEVYDVRPEGLFRIHDHAFNGIQPKSNFLPSRGRVTLASEDADLNWSEEVDDAGETILDCPADLNFDGEVDSADLGLLLGEWNQARSLADLDDDGTVGSSDLGLLLAAFGPCP